MPASDRGSTGASDRGSTSATDLEGTARAVRWLAAQTAVVALLAGVVHQLTLSTLLEGGFSYMGADISGLGAVVGLRAVQGFLLAGAALFACWPALVGGARRAANHDDGRSWPWLLAAALLPAATAAVVLLGASGDRWRLVVPVLLVLAALVLLSLAVSLAAAVWGRSTAAGRPVALALGVAALAVLAFGVGTTVAVPFAGLSETGHGGVPQVMFAYESTETADGTLLTITHDGGDRVRADRLHVEGDLAAVSGADQTREGPWNGTTSAAADGRVVEPGDTVTVGLADAEDCVVRVVYRRGADTATLGKYECSG
jgi:hypothetical protein